MLKLDKQISGTIYRPILAANEACHMEGVGAKLEGVGAKLEGVGYNKHAWYGSLDADFHHQMAT